MDTYEIVLITKPIVGRVDVIGFGIKKKGVEKLVSTNIYTGEEIKERLKQLNAAAAINANWPKADDPEVDALLKDEKFEPLNYDHNPVEAQSLVYQRFRNACETIAKKRAGLL